MKKLILATLASFLFLVIVNALVFPVFFPDGPPEQYSNSRPIPLFQFHLLAFLVTAFLMAYLYPLINRGGARWKEGLKVGVIMALFVSLPENLHLYAMADISFLVGVFPMLWVTVIWGVAGIVIALVYGKTLSESKH
jgi:hypothetical protein